ncbi:MAG: ribose-phosphate pyrophosphokinase [Chlamydiae bacterium]|nr:ribose-phosphate pyrophosphokinase [Chlamydiota bacterium]
MKKIVSHLVIFLLVGCSLPQGLLYGFEKEKALLKTSFLKENAILLSGNSNYPLAKEVAEYLRIPLGEAVVEKFNDGEINIQIKENVRNKEVYILQSTCPANNQSINDNLMELYLLIRTMKRASSGTITAIIPYYGYARQDRKSSLRVPISAADVALLLEVAGVDRIVTVDLHCGQIQGFFRDVPVDNLYAAAMFVRYFAKMQSKNLVVVSPDAGGVERAKQFIENLGKEGVEARMAIISKHRSKPGVVNSMNLIGDVQGADTIIVDDLCDTAGTLVQAAQLLKDHGASHVYAAITHPVFSGTALERIRNSVIDEMVISNTIPLSSEAPKNIRSISVAPLLAETIRRIHVGESVSDLFQKTDWMGSL